MSDEITPTGDSGSAGGKSETLDPLADSYAYVLALVEGKPDDAISVQRRYPDDQLRNLTGCAAGVLMAMFAKTSSTFRDKVAAGLRFGIDGDEKHLDGVKAADDMPGQYL